MLTQNIPIIYRTIIAVANTNMCLHKRQTCRKVTESSFWSSPTDGVLTKLMSGPDDTAAHRIKRN